MQKLFSFDEHIGEWRVLVQTRDIQNGAITTRLIADNAVTNDKIGDGEVQSRNIADNAVTNDKIGDGEVQSRNIGPGAVTSEKIEDGSITGDHFEKDAVMPGKIANNAVATRNIQDGAITKDKLHEDVMVDVIKPLLNEMVKDLQNQIDSIGAHGIAVSNQFGDDPHIGISQKRLTEVINYLLAKIDDLTGEVSNSILMTVDPPYFIGETGNIAIHAVTSLPDEIFEEIIFYQDNVEIAKAEDVNTFDINIEVTEPCRIACRAKMLGQWKTAHKDIAQYSEFWMGAGTDYQTIIGTTTYSVDITGGMRLAKDVTFEDDDFLYIIMAAGMESSFIRADMNGVEIEFDKDSTSEEGYVIFKSKNTFQAGTFNVDING